jgi:polyisoprenoid-binding protein YceI
MKRFTVLTAILVALLLLPLTAAAETWSVDPNHSAVTFKVRHIFTKVHGSFRDFSGTIVYDSEKPEASSVSFEIQATSVDTANESRDGHLRTADFFDAENHPTWNFKSTKAEGAGKGKLKVTGNLTMRGTTHEVTLEVETLGSMKMAKGGAKAGFSTSFTVDRTDYGIAFNRAIEGGGAMLGDEVEIEISIEAVLAEEAKS